MSLKRNILANYASQIYVTLIGIIMVPMYIKYMGVEAYGLVGFFAMLQAWFQLLDMGLAPTMAREAARFNGGATDAIGLRRLLRALEGVFIAIASVGCSILMIASDKIASDWLNVQSLQLTEVRNAILLMALIISLRWVCGLYRGAIAGFERLVWLSWFNIAIASLRFVVVIPILVYIGISPTIFFTYQLALAVLEMSILVVKTYKLLPRVEEKQHTPWHWASLHGVLRFSSSVAFTGAVWVLVTQTDRLVLSKLLPLAEYACFTLATLVASGVTVLSGPISGALLPRMTKLAAEKDDGKVISLYHKATQLVATIAIPSSLVIALFAEQVLLIWTKDPAIANKVAPILSLYVIGNGIFALASFPYFLQFAKGNLALHLIGSFLFLTLFIPILIYAVTNFGMMGAGYAWVSINIIYIILWTPMVHNKFGVGLHRKWLLNDIFPVVVSSLFILFLSSSFIQFNNSLVHNILAIAIVSIITFFFACMSSNFVRRFLFEKVQAKVKKNSRRRY